MQVRIWGSIALFLLVAPGASDAQATDVIGRETSGFEPISDSQIDSMDLKEVLQHGKQTFSAVWTVQEGGGRPLTTGTGNPLADPGRRLDFPNNFNRVSAMDSNGCAGCHNAPFGEPGGGGDFVTGVFVAGQRFDSATFDRSDAVSLSGAFNEAGDAVTLQSIGNYRATLGMYGSGYIEMLARQMTADLRATRDAISPGESAPLESKGVSFGTLARAADGTWDISAVEGLADNSLAGDEPSLVIQPFHQSGSVVSLRQFTNNAFNHHHGIQTSERFGDGVDADGDGFVNELSRADVTATAVWQAVLPVPGQVVPNDLAVEEAIFTGEKLFEQIGCASCHVSSLPLDDQGWVYTEPNPYNPAGNARPGEITTFSVDLSDPTLPGVRIAPGADGIARVPAYTDLKLHDITTGAPDDPNREALNINAPGGSPEFLGGNTRFITKKLWGAANERPYFHHGKYTTLREATLAHYGEAQWTRDNFVALSTQDRDKVIEFMKSLQVLAPGTKAAIVDEHGNEKLGWPPSSFFSWRFSRGNR